MNDEYKMIGFGTAIVLVILVIAIAVGINGCGHSSVDNELIGQVKKVKNITPIICPNHVVADISLGVMRNGIGSMSTQDVWVVINRKDADKYNKAAETGQLVKVMYDQSRIAPCYDSDHFATSIEYLP